MCLGLPGRIVAVTEGSDLVATTNALAAALEKESADLIVFGQQSSDSDGAVLWASVADRLRLPVISQVAELEVSDGKVRGKRQTEFGYDTIEAPTPAVLAVSDAINEPRYPSLKAIMGAKKKPLESVGAADAGIDAGRVGYDNARAHCSEFKAPPEKQAGQIIEDEDTNETVEKIVAWLDERKLLA